MTYETFQIGFFGGFLVAGAIGLFVYPILSVLWDRQWWTLLFFSILWYGCGYVLVSFRNDSSWIGLFVQWVEKNLGF